MLRHDAIPPAVKHLLLELAPHPALSGFALGGGTSLAMRFGHRISVDLDFFTQDPFHPDEIAASLAALKPEIMASARNSLTTVASGVKLDFLRHAYPLLAPVEVIDGIAMLSMEDVAAMKLNAVSNLGSKTISTTWRSCSPDSTSPLCSPFSPRNTRHPIPSPSSAASLGSRTRNRSRIPFRSMEPLGKA